MRLNATSPSDRRWHNRGAFTPARYPRSSSISRFVILSAIKLLLNFSREQSSTLTGSQCYVSVFHKKWGGRDDALLHGIDSKQRDYLEGHYCEGNIAHVDLIYF